LADRCGWVAVFALWLGMALLALCVSLACAGRWQLFAEGEKR